MSTLTPDAAFGPKEIVVLKGFLRNYYSGSGKCCCCNEGHGHASYRGVLHDLKTDDALAESEAMNDCLRGLPEGTVVEVLVRCVGRVQRKPFVLLRSHEYGVRR